MCDYSLEAYATRKAKKGDNLVIHRFESGSSGFVGANDRDTAVCLAPGAKLNVQKPNEEPREAIFVQRKRQPMTCRDSLKFAGEQDTILLGALPMGTTAKVLALSLNTEPEYEKPDVYEERELVLVEAHYPRGNI